MNKLFLFLLLNLPLFASASVITYTSEFDIYDNGSDDHDYLGKGTGSYRFDEASSSIIGASIHSDQFSMDWDGAIALVFGPGTGNTVQSDGPIQVDTGAGAFTIWFDYFFVAPGENPLQHLDNQAPGDAYMEVFQDGDFWCMGPWQKQLASADSAQSPASVPEPASGALLGLGIVALLWRAALPGSEGVSVRVNA